MDEKEEGRIEDNEERDGKVQARSVPSGVKPKGPRKHKPTRAKMVSVRVIRQKGQSALVEWMEGDEFKRGTIPPGRIANGDKVAERDLRMAIPYGLPWEELIADALDAEGVASKIQHELRRRGLWTAEDVLDNAQGTLSAIQSAYGFDLSSLRQIAAKAQRDQKK